MFSVSTLQRLREQRLRLERTVPAHARFKNVPLFGRHEYAARCGGDDGRDGLANAFTDHVKTTPKHARRAGLRSNPKRTRLIALQRQDSTRRQTAYGHGLSPAAIEFCQARFRSEPHRAISPLRDCINAIRRQPVKKCDCAPLMQSR